MSLWFVVPAHGRLGLTRICLEQLRRTCDALEVDATAVVIADDENLDTAAELGFATIHRDNQFLARKYNDGLQLALDPEVNPHPADYAVPFGSDDFIDHRILSELPASNEVLAFQQVAFVSEDGRELSETRQGQLGGVGIRVYPRQLFEPCGYRPADEDRKRGCDTSILYNARHHYRQRYRRDFRVLYGDRHPRQIVDWKSSQGQLNPYAEVAGRVSGDPFHLLQDIYPDEALEQMAEHYA